MASSRPSIGSKKSPTDEDALIVTAPLERTAELSAALGREEVYVVETAPIQISLEDYFLQVTGDKEEA